MQDKITPLACVFIITRLYNGTPNMGSKRFDTERSEVENLVKSTVLLDTVLNKSRSIFHSNYNMNV